MLAAPGVAGKGEVVGKPQRQWGSGRREHLTWREPPARASHSHEIPGGTMQAVSGPGIFVAQRRAALAE